MNNYKLTYLVFILIGLPIIVLAQNKPKVYFKEGDTLRLESNNKQALDATITIIVPKNGDTTDKKNVPNQDIIRNGKISIELDKENSTALLSKVKLPVSNEFKLDSIKEKNEFTYQLTLPRDPKDDKILFLSMRIKNEKGEEFKELSKKIVIYIKPYTLDTLRSGRNYELWFLTGTNFDLFDGVKAQEFFFRTNCLFKISNKFFGQFAFYKNRYFSGDTTNSATSPFSTITKPDFGDSLYTITAGNFRKKVKQISDPLGLQFDILYKITNRDESNFFLTFGFDYATTNVTINNQFTFDTTFRLKTSMPDTVRGDYNSRALSLPLTVSYKKPSYNINIGFMWILNEDDVNIKAQLVAGISNFTNSVSSYQSRGAGLIYTYESSRQIYLQLKTFATYRPLGISFGLESFIRRSEVPAFNFTLSKAFDIVGLIKNFTPVSGLKIPKD